MTDEAAVPEVRPRILVFFDYVCPLCYLEWPRLKRLREEHDVELFLVPFELRPQLSAEGASIEDIGAGHSEHVEEYMRRLAAEGGLEIDFPGFMPNSHRALVVGEYARDLGPEIHERVHEAIFSAFNGRGEDIGREDTLLRVAGECGLDRTAVAEALASGGYEERLHRFTHLGIDMGVTATPAALVCNQLMIGSRPYEVVERALAECLADIEGAAGVDANPAV